MDPRTSAQDLMRCDLCKTAMVQMYCDTCLVKMCKACVGEHFSTDFSKPHKIMDFKDRKSTPLYPGCTSHDKERCEMYCNQCDISICSKCVVSGKHSSHKIITILQAYTTKKEKVLKNKTELNETIFPAYQDIASDLEKRIRQLGKEYGDLSTAITKHGEDCHREIDKLVQKLNAEAEEMKTTQLHTLQKQLEEVKRKMSDIKDEISSMDAALDTNDTSELFNATFNVGEYKKLPQKIVPSVPKFTPWRVQGKFCKLFGTLSSISVPSKEHGYSIKTTQKSPEAASPSTQQHMPVSQQVPGRPQGGHLKVPAAPNCQTGYKEYGANQRMKWPQSQNPGMQQAPPQAVIVQDPLTPTMLATAPPQEQKQMLGERLFPLISQLFPDLAGKITGMLLEIDNSELLHMLESQESLEAKVIEAVAVLQAHQAKESATTTNIHWQYK